MLTQTTLRFVHLVNEDRMRFWYKDFNTNVKWLISALDGESVKSTIVLEGDILGVLRGMENHYGVGLIAPDDNIVNMIENLRECNGNVETFMIFDLKHLFQVV